MTITAQVPVTDFNHTRVTKRGLPGDSTMLQGHMAWPYPLCWSVSLAGARRQRLGLDPEGGRRRGSPRPEENRSGLASKRFGCFVFTGLNTRAHRA